MSQADPAYIFLSYASEDKDLVTAIEKSLESLGAELAYTLEPVRDIHHFEHGHTLKGQIYENLLKSSVLFIVYTEALKKSHSYTGIEIGMFEAMSRGEAANKIKSRRTVSLYLDEPPPSEADILGIKLNRDALSSAGEDTESRIKRLDPSNALEEFLTTTAFKVIDNVMAAEFEGHLDNLAKKVFDEKKISVKAAIKDIIAPKLLADLFDALSRVIERSSVQQKLITLRWTATEVDNAEAMYGARLILKEGRDGDLSELFGITDRYTSISWQKFTLAIKRGFPSDAEFICKAISNAVTSALRPGPVDNEQFFLTPSKEMFRIIVTRHYSFYDGSRLMHMYFIPILSRFARDDISGTLALLNSAVQFRNLFIRQFGDLSITSLKDISFDINALKTKMGEFLRCFMMLEDESHVYGLDDPSHFAKINRLIGSSTSVSTTFDIWREQKSALLTATKELYMLDEVNNFVVVRDKWFSVYNEFSKTVDELNRNLGRASTRFLDRWFDDGGAAHNNQKKDSVTSTDDPNF